MSKRHGSWPSAVEYSDAWSQESSAQDGIFVRDQVSYSSEHS